VESLAPDVLALSQRKPLLRKSDGGSTPPGACRWVARRLAAGAGDRVIHVHSHIQFSGDDAPLHQNAHRRRHRKAFRVCRRLRPHSGRNMLLPLPEHFRPVLHRLCRLYRRSPPVGADDFSPGFLALPRCWWYTFDAATTTPRNRRGCLSRGRDAADVPFLRSFGEARADRLR